MLVRRLKKADTGMAVRPLPRKKPEKGAPNDDNLTVRLAKVARKVEKSTKFDEIPDIRLEILAALGDAEQALTAQEAAIEAGYRDAMRAVRNEVPRDNPAIEQFRNKVCTTLRSHMHRALKRAK